MRALLIIVMCVFFMMGCNNPSEPLRIGSNRWLGYTPIYLADELGWNKPASIRLVEYPTATGVIRGMHNGILDAAFLTLDEAILLQSTGHDIEIILITNLSVGADVLYAQSYIRSLRELKGKRIALEGSTLSAYFLSKILDKAELSADEVKVANIPLYMHLDALNNGTIDASISTAAIQNQALETGAIPLFTSRDLHEDILNVLVVNRERISPELRARIRALWYTSLDAWLEHRTKSDPLLCKRLGIDEQSLQRILNGLVMGDKALNDQYFNQDLLAKHIKKVHAYMLSKGLLLQPFDSTLLLRSCLNGRDPC